MTIRGFPLAGLKVLDLSRVLAGPVCTQLLGDLGADVVKVERPGVGDDTRQWGPPFLGGDGPSAYYLSCNRNKRSLALDLKNPASRPVLEDLLRTADVLVENFLPDAVAQFGLTPERLAEINPRLVSCSISGFGRTGPLAAVPGYDLVTQAGSGLMAITGDSRGEPAKVGVAISDLVTGLYAAASALAGLYARGHGEAGMAFDLSLADCTLASLVNVVQSVLVTGERPQRWGNGHPQIVPYGTFETADGYLVIGIGSDGQWRKFCAAVGRQDWADDPRFAKNAGRVEHRGELLGMFDHLVRERTTHHWQELLTAIDIPHGPVLEVDQAIRTPQAVARETVLPVVDSQGRSYPLLGSAVHWHDEPPRHVMPPPDIGQHTDEVLHQWLGYDDATVARLRSDGAIA